MFHVIGENDACINAYGAGETVEAAVIRWATDGDHEVKCEIDACKVFFSYKPRIIRGEALNLVIKFVVES